MDAGKQKAMDRMQGVTNPRGTGRTWKLRVCLCDVLETEGVGADCAYPSDDTTKPNIFRWQMAEGGVVSIAVLERAAAQPTRKNSYWVVANSLRKAANLTDPVSAALVRALVQIPANHRAELRAHVQAHTVSGMDDLTQIVKNFSANH
jgi:hypothetical protein